MPKMIAPGEIARSSDENPWARAMSPVPTVSHQSIQ